MERAIEEVLGAVGSDVSEAVRELAESEHPPQSGVERTGRNRLQTEGRTRIASSGECGGPARRRGGTTRVAGMARCGDLKAADAVRRELRPGERRLVRG